MKFPVSITTKDVFEDKVMSITVTFSVFESLKYKVALVFLKIGCRILGVSSLQTQIYGEP